MVSYGKDGGRLTLLQEHQKLLEFKEWRKQEGLHTHHNQWLSLSKPQDAQIPTTLK